MTTTDTDIREEVVAMRASTDQLAEAIENTFAAYKDRILDLEQQVRHLRISLRQMASDLRQAWGNFESDPALDLDQLHMMLDTQGELHG